MLTRLLQPIAANLMMRMLGRINFFDKKEWIANLRIPEKPIGTHDLSRLTQLDRHGRL
jgi:hypothetical protein